LLNDAPSQSLATITVVPQSAKLWPCLKIVLEDLFHFESNTWRQNFIFAHILFHRLCENGNELSKATAKGGQNGQSKGGPEVENARKGGRAQIMGGTVFPLGINGFDLALGPCSQSCPQKM
jgi:hypothetical protein